MSADNHPGDHRTGAAAQDHTDHRHTMLVMMAGCCLAIPLAILVAGVSAGGLADAQPWLLGTAAMLAIALVVVQRTTGRHHRAAPPAPTSITDR